MEKRFKTCLCFCAFTRSVSRSRVDQLGTIGLFLTIFFVPKLVDSLRVVIKSVGTHIMHLNYEIRSANISKIVKNLVPRWL